jgi:hypothetical protein
MSQFVTEDVRQVTETQFQQLGIAESRPAGAKLRSSTQTDYEAFAELMISACRAMYQILHLIFRAQLQFFKPDFFRLVLLA